MCDCVTLVAILLILDERMRRDHNYVHYSLGFVCRQLVLFKKLQTALWCGDAEGLEQTGLERRRFRELRGSHMTGIKPEYRLRTECRSELILSHNRQAMTSA